MFRFTIRDLLWLTLVVAVGLAWFAREQQLRARLNRVEGQATRWRRAAGTLEYVLKEQFYRLDWDFDKAQVRLYLPSDGEAEHLSYNLTLYEPSVCNE
jgi:hypothetical protein